MASKSRALRYSLRSIGVFVAVLAAALSWLASWERTARQKRHAVEAIELAGGDVSWDVQRSLPLPPTVAPRWLVKALGPEYFGNVNGVTTGEATDEHLSLLKSLHLLEILDVHGHSISDKGLMRLSRLPHLEDLRLTGVDLSSSGLAQLQESQSLGVLWLIDTNVTGQHLSHLSGVASVHWLVVEDRDFTDEDLLHLRDATQLRCIQLGQTKVTEAGVVELATYLPECSISVGVGYFAGGGYFAVGPEGPSRTYFSHVPGEGLWKKGALVKSIPFTPSQD